MNTYKLLIADDEEEVIDAIMAKMDWEGLGFSVVGTANNGVKALEIAEEKEPDAVLTDIKMPYMDGLELSRRLKKRLPETKLLLFTGFDELEYAKEAIHLEVEEYITKPVNATELTEIFRKLHEKLDHEYDEKRNVEKLRHYFDESLPLLQVNFFVALIEGRIDADRIQSYLDEYQLAFEMPYHTAVVFHTSRTHTPEGVDPILLSVSVQKEAERYFLEHRKARFFTYLGNTCMIVGLSNTHDLSDLTDECDTFCREMKRGYGAVVTAGIGELVSNFLDISSSYAGAREAVSYRVLYGMGRALNIREVAPNEMESLETIQADDLQLIFKNILLNSEEDVRQAVDDWFLTSIDSCKTIRQYNTALMELASAIYRFATENAIDIDEITGGDDLFVRFPKIGRDELFGEVYSLAQKLQEALNSRRNETTKSFVYKAIDYIHLEYGDSELSVDKMAGILSVSESYFQSVFKKVTGKTFTAYLTDFRMQEAKRLLTETDDKNYVIAEKLGYTDANYFSYVFKKQFGTTPTKYRTENRTGQQ